MKDSQELWRVEYAMKAYRDQTGMTHSGYLVHEQVVIYGIEQFDSVPDPYNASKPLPVYRGHTTDGRRFIGHTNWDSGAVSWHEDVEHPSGVTVHGYWKKFDAASDGMGVCLPGRNGAGRSVEAGSADVRLGCENMRCPVETFTVQVVQMTAPPQPVKKCPVCSEVGTELKDDAARVAELEGDMEAAAGVIVDLAEALAATEWTTDKPSQPGVYAMRKKGVNGVHLTYALRDRDTKEIIYPVDGDWWLGPLPRTPRYPPHKFLQVNNSQTSLGLCGECNHPASDPAHLRDDEGRLL